MRQQRYDEVFTVVKDLYQYMYRLTANFDDYVFTPSDKEVTMIKNFIKTLDKRYVLDSVGNSIIVRYFLYQFNYWSELDTRFDGKIMLGWVIGKKAFERWLDIDNKSKERYFNNIYFTKKKGVSFNNILALFTVNKSDTVKMASFNPHEELEKLRYYNTERGFVHCIESTWLFNSKSVHCAGCKFQEDCKQLLINNYPGLANQRNVTNEQ